ncbi:hypothetical protein V1512DRAFT_265613 [Lipomyces arxii]|uniref:uncharacterized protein n=1 Tax=Lipomyces arxii TaxID=56418 RepID=UPI0034CEEBB0
MDDQLVSLDQEELVGEGSSVFDSSAADVSSIRAELAYDAGSSSSSSASGAESATDSISKSSSHGSVSTNSEYTPDAIVDLSMIPTGLRSEMALVAKPIRKQKRADCRELIEKDADGKIIVKRKSHRKSKTGCITCRQRRVKCDEQLPVCANCVRHRVRCDYEALTPGELHDRYLSQLVERVMCMLSRRTLGLLRPFAALRPLQTLNNTDVRLLQHISQLSTHFVAVRPEHALIWKQVGVQNTQRHPFLLHAFLALGAAHAGSLMQSPDLFRVALEHKNIALRGAQEALSNFNRENAESVLAVSMLLSWQAFYTEDRDPTGGSLFASLAHGIYTVLIAMGFWRDEFPVAALYFYTIRPETWPLPIPLEDGAIRNQIFGSLMTHIARLQPLCLDTVNPTRRLCFSALMRELNAFIAILNTGEFDTHAHEEQMRITEPFSRWQQCFVPSEAGPANMPVGYRGIGDLSISESILHSYSDPVVRLLFAYFYATGLLIDGLWPATRRSGSIVTRLGPLESLLRGIRSSSEWWNNIDGYAYFASRVVDCYKVRSWMPVVDTALQIELPPRVVEVLWYGLMESVSLNKISHIR